LDQAVNSVLWKFTNLFPGCLIKSIDSVRAKKKFFWDIAKNYNRHWLAVNMMTEAFLGFHAYNTKDSTGKDVVDFIKYRQMIAEGRDIDDAFKEAVLPQPKKE
jgi:6-oxo-cyclohex-1-ene-carbonyl-CoA hydrolase